MMKVYYSTTITVLVALRFISTILVVAISTSLKNEKRALHFGPKPGPTYNFARTRRILYRLVNTSRKKNYFKKKKYCKKKKSVKKKKM